MDYIIKVEIYTLFNKKLEKLWIDFEKESVYTPFQTYAWLSHWQQTLGDPLHKIIPQIVIIYLDQDIIAILPFGIRKWKGIRLLEWLGSINTDYMGPLLSSKWEQYSQKFSELWNQTINSLGSFDVIHFYKQPEKLNGTDNPFASRLGIISEIKTFQSTLESSWGIHYQKRLKKKIRNDSRRQRHRLEKIGKLNFIVAFTQREKENIIKNMIRQKARRYIDTGNWNMFSSLEYRTFYEGLSKLEDDYLKIHCTALKVGDTIIASHVGFVYKDIFYYLMPAYEGGNWERYSPGRILLEGLLEWSIQNELKIFDFTIGGEQYKKNWCDIQGDLYELLKPISFKGQFYKFYYSTTRIIFELSWFGPKLKIFLNWVRNQT